jgi:hypothetical protein
MATPPVGTPPNWSDFFGWSLSLSGNKLLVGAPEVFSQMTGPTGGAYVFTQSPSGDWVQSQLLVSPLPVTLSWFGRAVAFSGDAIIVGESSYNMTTEGSRGAAHVFAQSDGVWAETQLIQASDSANMDDRNFGASIAADGEHVLIGAPGPDYSSTGIYPQGAVYAFSNANGSLSEIQKLSASDGAPGDQFGYSVALSGTTLLTGAAAANVGANTHQGAAYVFDRSSGPFTQIQKLVAADGVAYDQFGQSVSISVDSALLGMWSFNDEPGGQPPPSKAGRVGVYVASNGIWIPVQDLAAGDSTNGNSFGWDVATDGQTLLVGADADGSISQYQGSAYFYSQDTLFNDGFDGPP